jgi:hypothetical protein
MCYLRLSCEVDGAFARSMVRPCVARGFIDLAGLRSCINVSGLSLERVALRAIMDISARAFSLPDRPQAGPNGSPGFAGAGKTDPPFRFILSQTSAGKRGLCHLLSPDQCSSFVRAIRPFLRPGLRVFRGIARRGRQGWPSRSALHHVCVSRPRLDGREHGCHAHAGRDEGAVDFVTSKLRPL